MLDELQNDEILRHLPDLEGYKLAKSCLIYAKLGRGGMGSVYLGWDLQLEREMAIKFLRPDCPPECVARFKREANLLAQLSHQNLVRIFYRRYAQGLHYLVMENVPGENAAEWVKTRGAMPPSEAVTVVLNAARGLSAMHEREVVHRDVKPENILISTSGEVKLVDLGLGRRGTGSQENLTEPGVTLGSPRYMAPEQWEGSEKVRPASDVWSLGATLYFLCTAKPPYDGDDLQEMMLQTLNKPFPSFSDDVKDAPRVLGEILRRCTFRDPKSRYPTAKPLVADLERLVREEGYPERIPQFEDTLAFPPPPVIPEDLATAAREIFGESQAPVRLERKPVPGLRSIGVDSTATNLITEGEEPVASRRTLAWVIGSVLLAAVVGLGYFYYNPDDVVVSPPELWKQGIDALFMKSHDTALEKFRRLYAIDPEFPKVRFGLATALVGVADRKKEDEQQLGDAYEQVTEARVFHESTDLGSREQLGDAYDDLTADIKELHLALSRKVASRLEESLHSPDISTRSFWPPTFSLGGKIDMRRLRSSGLESAEVRVDGNPVRPGRDGTYEVDFKDLPDGPKRVEIEVVFEGIKVAAKPLTLLVDAVPPEITFIEGKGPPTGWCGSTVAIEGRVRDSDPSVKVHASIDSKPVDVERDADRWSVQLLDLDEGHHDVVITAVDSVQQKDTEAFTVRVDRDPPELTVWTPPETGWIRQASPGTGEVDIWAEVDDVSEVTLRVDGKQVPATKEGRIHRWAGSLEEGVHDLEIEAEDARGNRSEKKFIKVGVDGTPPELVVLQPKELDGVQPSPVKIEGTATDRLSPLPLTINIRTVTPGGEELSETVETDLEGKWSKELDLEDGEYDIVVEATDVAKNPDVKRLSFRVDTRSPELEILVPEEGDWVNSSTIGISGTARDDSGIVRLTVDGTPIEMKPRDDPRDLERRWEATLDGLEDGEHRVTVVAEDARQAKTTRVRRFFVDRQKPRFEQLSVKLPRESIDRNPANTDAGGRLERVLTRETSVTIEVLVSDGHGALPEVSIDGTTVKRDADGRFRHRVALAENTERTVACVATDRAGNPGRVEIPIVCDARPPKVHVTTPLSDGVALQDGRLTIEGTVDEDATVLVYGPGGPVRATARDGAWIAKVPFTGSSGALQVAAEDAAGNVSARVTHQIEKVWRSFDGFTFKSRNAEGYPEYVHDRSGILMVLLPAGHFMMGSDETNDEQPVHKVSLGEFLIAKYELTQAQWARVMTPEAPPPAEAIKTPRGGLSWDDCVEFCRRAGLSLPTEAQWEYACRAGTSTLYAFGDSVTRDQVNHGEDLTVEQQKAVLVDDPGFPANGFGLYHMHGNMYEWCEDVYDLAFYKRSPNNDPACEGIPGLREAFWKRVLRGGSYRDVAPDSRAAKRWAESPKTVENHFGLRPVYKP